jgi:hypothetical protein
MSETLFATLLVAAALAWLEGLRRNRSVWALLSGILLGLAALVRPIGLLLVPLWSIVTVVAGRQKFAWRSALLSGLILIAGASVVTLPWAARNLAVHDEFMFSGVTGRTFYNFNIAVVKAAAEGTTRDEATAQIGAQRGELLDSLDVIADYPLIFLREQAKGLFRTLLGLEAGSWARLFGYPEALRGGLGIVSTLLSGDAGGAFDRVRAVLSDPRTGPILAVAAAAEAHAVVLYALLASLLIFGRKRLGDAFVLGMLLTVAVLVLVPAAAGQARFRIPAEPLLVVLAVLGWASFRSRSRRRESAGHAASETASTVAPDGDASGDA